MAAAAEWAAVAVDISMTRRRLRKKSRRGQKNVARLATDYENMGANMNQVLREDESPDGKVTVTLTRRDILLLNLCLQLMERNHDVEIQELSEV